jgi:hypothetical protein
MRDFDGDTTKLATHRDTRLSSGGTFKVKSGDVDPPKFHSGGLVTAHSGPVLSGLDNEHRIPSAAAKQLRESVDKLRKKDAKPITVDVNVQDLVRPIISKMIENLIRDHLLGVFPFMLETRPQRLVVIESPFGHPTKVGMEENAAYARQAMLDSLKRGEAPYASHLLYTQCLDDLKTAERKQGMEAGFAWGRMAQHVAVYTDRGVSRGMLEGIKRHQEAGKTIEFRSIA